MTSPPVGARRAVSESSVVLIVSADSGCAALVRAVAGHLCARTELTITEVIDLRLALDEVVGLLMSDVSDSVLRCRFDQTETGLRVVLRTAGVGRIRRPDTGGFGWQVLSSLVDTLDWSHSDGEVRVELLKAAVEHDSV
jgi:hypothetical protein